MIYIFEHPCHIWHSTWIKNSFLCENINHSTWFNTFFASSDHATLGAQRSLPEIFFSICIYNVLLLSSASIVFSACPCYLRHLAKLY